MGEELFPEQPSTVQMLSLAACCLRPGLVLPMVTFLFFLAGPAASVGHEVS